MNSWIQALGQRIGLFYASSLLLLVLALAGNYQVHSQQLGLGERDLANLKGIGASMIELDASLLELRTIMERDRLDLDPAELDRAREAIRIYEERLEHVLELWNEIGERVDPSLRLRFSQPLGAIQAYLEGYKASQSPSFTTLAGVLTELGRRSNELSDQTIRMMVVHHEGQAGSVERLRPFLQVFTLLAPVMLLLTTLVTQLAIVGPFHAMERQLRDAGGRAGLSLLHDPSGRDELGGLGRVYHRFLERLESVLFSLLRIHREVSSASGELARGLSGQLEGLRRQNGQVVQATQAAQDIVGAVSDVTRSTQRAHERSSDTLAMARSSREVMEQTVSSMTRVAAGVEELSGSIEGLARSTERIGEVLALIEDIADQTNLLALNASIEAARAGERGRGFAVVADEIRNLSEKISRSAHEITRILGQVQVGTTKAAELVNTSSAQVDKGFTSAREAGAALARILINVEEISQAVENIRERSNEEQSQADRVQSHLQGVAGGVDEATRWAQSALRAAQDLAETSGQAQRLLDRVEMGSEPLGEKRT